MDLEELWRKYKRTGDISARNAIISHHYKLVSTIAAKIHPRLPPHIERDDLISYGTVGLFDAVEKYDPDRGIKFETYASTRIQGSILDEIRSQDWVPRSVRSRQKQVERKRLELEAAMGHQVSTQDIADDLGWDEQQVSKVLFDSSAIRSMNASYDAGSSEGGTLQDYLISHDDGNSDLLKNLAAQMREGIEGLPDKERTVIALYYWEGLTLQEIGVMLGVTESRVCQIHSKALSMLV